MFFLSYSKYILLDTIPKVTAVTGRHTSAARFQSQIKNHIENCIRKGFNIMQLLTIAIYASPQVYQLSLMHSK